MIREYKLVKNLPPGFFDRGLVDLEALFGSDYFEWQDASKRMILPPLVLVAPKNS